MDSFFVLIALSVGAGIAGTGIGGALGALCADKGEKVTAAVLAFAGGVMLGVTAFEMIPESIECFSGVGRWGAACALASLLGGALFVGLMSKLLQRRQSKKGVGMLAFVDTLSESANEGGKGRMLRAGVVMLFAIALHNLPEGMAIGGAGSRELSAGVTVALALALHNVPEGMAISAPLVGGGMKAFKAIILTCLAGASTLIGALIGIGLGGLGDVATGVCLGASAGAMLFVTLADILPETVVMAGKLPYMSVFAGIVCAAGFVWLV